MKWLDAFAAKIYIIFSAEQKFAPFPGNAGRQNNAGCKTTVKQVSHLAEPTKKNDFLGQEKRGYSTVVGDCDINLCKIVHGSNLSGET